MGGRYKNRRPKFCFAIIVIYKSHKSHLHHNVSLLSLHFTFLETCRKTNILSERNWFNWLLGQNFYTF